MCWSIHFLSTIKCFWICLWLVRAAVWATQHFKKPNDAFCDGAVMEINIIGWLFFLVCLLDSKVYTTIITFTPMVLNSVTVQGLPSYFIIISTYQLVDFCILTGSRDMEYHTAHEIACIFPILYYCSEFIFHFAFLCHAWGRSVCLLMSVTPEYSMYWSLLSIVYELKNQYRYHKHKSHNSGQSRLGPFNPHYYKVE